MQAKILTVALVALAAIATGPPSAHAAATPQLNRATVVVQRDARHLNGSRQSRLAWATFEYVARNINGKRHTQLAASGRQPTTMDEAISKRAGSCGLATQTALAIADEVGLQARPVEFYYTEANGTLGSHIMAEFKVNGRWQLYDFLFGAVYRSRGGKLLGASELWKMPLRSQLARQERIPDETRVWYTNAGHDPFRYLADPRSEMTINDRGTVSMQRTGSGWAPGANRLAYIGEAATFGTRTGLIAQRLVSTGGSRQITVHLTSGCGSGRIVATSRITTSAALDASTTSVTLPVSGSSVVLSAQGGCYAIIQSIDG
jgi:hypothetical protein